MFISIVAYILCSMEKQLFYTTFSPEVRETLASVRSLVQGVMRDVSIKPDEGIRILKGGLESRLGDIGKLREALLDDMRINDGILQKLGQMLASRYIRGHQVRTYEVSSECPVCEESDLHDNHHDNRQEVPVEYYVNELDLRRGEVMDMLLRHGFKPDCPQCGSSLDITSAGNLIYPASNPTSNDIPSTLEFIKTRVKSAGRYCHKLIDLIFYDETDPRWEKRSITDKYAFSLVLNAGPETDEPTFRDSFIEQMGHRLPEDCSEREFRNFFRYRLDMELPVRCDFDDLVCYAMLKRLKTDYPECIGLVQDGIKEPKERKNSEGRIELYKMLQFDFNIHGKRFECQIKSKDMHRRELDRDSATCHFTYRKVEEYLRRDMYMQMPEAGEVYNFLFRLFHKEAFRA